MFNLATQNEQKVLKKNLVGNIIFTQLIKTISKSQEEFGTFQDFRYWIKSQETSKIWNDSKRGHSLSLSLDVNTKGPQPRACEMQSIPQIFLHYHFIPPFYHSFFIKKGEKKNKRKKINQEAHTCEIEAISLLFTYRTQ